MIYHNPIVKGYYPDPSVCCVDGTYYMACSSFHHFPGVPLFESRDLVNWKPIGHCLTRKSQLPLDGAAASGGIYAPTIRYHEGRFYMVTTNCTKGGNFYVYTDDIYGEWSEPIYVDQGGIDPSLFFEDGRTYFTSNGFDEQGVQCIHQCEIDIETGHKRTPTIPVFYGTGGRYVEGPHLYKIDGYYYMLTSEGGTEYGHMLTYARSRSPWGPFELAPNNPLLTNRNKAPFPIQGIGHGELIRDGKGEWHVISLGFRQAEIGQFHHLGREVFMTPARFEDGWFYAGNDGTTDWSYELEGDFEQTEKKKYTLSNMALDRTFLRNPIEENYTFTETAYTLRGTDVTLSDRDTPTFVGIRQRDYDADITATVTADGGEAGLTVIMAELEHYDVALRRGENGAEAILRLNIGGIQHVAATIPVSAAAVTLKIRSKESQYTFSVLDGERETTLGTGYSKYLSSEVAGGFTGVFIGMYATGNNTATFTDFLCEYK